MTWRIARKELLGNLITMRFSVGTALFLALVVLFTSVLISDYRQKLERYNGMMTKNSEELRQLMTYQNLRPTVYKPPEVLSVFSRGVEDNIAKEVQISIASVPVPKGAYTAKNPLLSVFPVLDIVLIFKLVISILILLFVYDAISGEKEDRTLALMLSNDVPRHQVLLGKFIGGMITISIPITIGFIAASLILSVSPTVNLAASEWLRIVLMYLVSLIMAGALCCLGLFFSSITRQASETLIFLFFLWVLFVLVVPNSSSFMAAKISPVKSRREIDSQITEFHRELGNKVRDFYRQYPRTDYYYVQSDATEPGGYYHWYASKSQVRLEQGLYAFSEPLQIDYADRAWQLEKSYLESLKKQKKLASTLSLISPLSVYEILVSALAKSDAASFERFYEQAVEYRRQLIDYLYDKKAFSSIRYFATVKEEHLFDVKNIEEYSALRKKYENVKAKHLNLDDLPRFSFKPESPADTLKRILPGFGLLCFIGVLFFICAFVAFLKYDVR